MPASNGEHDQVAAALGRLAIAMEHLQQRYDAAERANRRVRIVLIAVLILFGGVAYQALSPVAKLIGVVAQARPEPLDSATAAARREELLKILPPDDRARLEQFEAQQRGSGVPLLQVAADVGEEVGQVHRIAHEPVRPARNQAAQGRADAKAPAQAETGPEQNADQAYVRPGGVTGRRAKLRDWAYG